MAIVKPYFDRILTLTKGIAMIISSRSSQPLARRNGLARFVDWWPAAVIGILAILSAAPDSNAQTFLSLL